MSFRVTLHAVPSVSSYEQALALHTKAAEKPWNNSRLPERVSQYYPAYCSDHALPGKRQRTCGVRMQNENIIFRLHSTDVVTWRPDGSVRVEVYNSQSTCVFINNFIPRHLMISLHSNGFVMRNLETFDATPLRDDFTIFADGTIGDTDPVTFALRRINKPVAKRLREELGYPAFAKWRKIMEPLLVNGRSWAARHEARWAVDRTGIRDTLQDREMWPQFIIGNMPNSTILTNLYDRSASEVYYHDHFDTVQYRKDGRWINLSRYRIMRSA
jgi:hypothetical protein